MKKDLKVFFIFLSLVIILFAFINADIDSDKIDDEVFQKVQEQNETRVVITIANDTTWYGKNNFEKNKDEVSDIIGNDLMHEFDNKISADVSKNELEDLAMNYKVESVELVELKKLFLTQATPLINATNAWNLKLAGINITGAGEAVCILDSGTNFSHPDLLNKNLTCVIDCVSGVSCIENCSISDDNGHGTQVAGIIGANGTLKGVAPDVGLISVKVCNSAGNCFDDDIRAGMDWCINNASKYNISVLSLSLGSGFYDSYCDSVNDPSDLTSAINNAVAKNISVIVATGNDANYTHIASPACVKNATAVGMVYDANVGGLNWGSPVVCTDLSTSADMLVCVGDRNSLTDLLAPGTLINSTYPSGYYEGGGTSMATPMVSGAFVLLRQFKRLETGEILTPISIQATLNSTGKQITDTGKSGLTFSRIDILTAIDSIKIISLNVTLISPTNNTYVNSITNFTCSAVTNSSSSLINSTFYIWNSTKDLIYNETNNLIGSSNQSSFNYTFSVEGNYNWNCLFSDNYSNSTFAKDNFTITYDITKPNVSLISPGATYSATGTTAVNFQYNVTESNLANCSFILNNVIEQTNSSVNVSMTNQFTKSLVAGSYTWNVNCSDKAGNINNDSSRTITISVSVSSNPSSSSSSGGGSSGGGSASTSTSTSMIYSLNDLEIKNGVSKNFKKGDVVKFEINKELHSLTLNSISTTEANVRIQSQPIDLALRINEARKLNINKDNYYDLEVSLLSIKDLKAEIKLKEIYEEIPVKNILEENDAASNLDVTGDVIANLPPVEYASFLKKIIVLLVILIVLVVFVIFGIKKRKILTFLLL